MKKKDSFINKFVARKSWWKFDFTLHTTFIDDLREAQLPDRKSDLTPPVWNDLAFSIFDFYLTPIRFFLFFI